MLRISLLIALDEQGNGAIGVAEQDVVGALHRSSRVAIAQVSVWRLCAAILRPGTVPLQFRHTWSFARTSELRRVV